jgi:endonuclease/exonuclease/phosphatase family metal-dependent hydrolase
MLEGSMDIESIARRLSSFLAPFLGYLLKQKKYEGATGDKDTHAWETAKTFWSKLGPGIRQRAALQEVLQDAAVSPYDGDALASLRLQLKKLLSDNKALAEELSSIWKEAILEEERDMTVMDFGDMRWRDALDRHDDMLRRLDMIRLLRAGMPPEKIAEEFVTDTGYLYRLNAAFSLNGMHGILSPDPRNWLDRLNKDDPILRRLEMIRLVRSGTPPPVVAGEFDALTEYIQRINERFSRNGVIGILTEEDFREFRSIHPEVISICTFNLHGMHENNRQRLRRIAHEMSDLDPSLCAFQEVISGGGIRETSAEIAEWMTRMTGSRYQTHFAYCHLFMEKFPEGVSVSSKYPLRNLQIIDLNKGLGKGLNPLMERYAAAAEIEIYGRRSVFVSVHLDHTENREIRHAQAEKLLSELKRLYREKDHYCSILAGDFNDVEDSPVMNFLKKEGYQDTYRHCNSGRGDTFTASDPHARIDYIMVKGDVHIHSAQLVPDNPELSDHRGVFAVIE